VAAAELSLSQSEKKLRGLFELSPIGIALTDMNGHYLEFNEAFRVICGYTKEELAVLDYWALTPRKYEQEEAIQLELLAKTGRYGPYEKEYIRKDGTLIPLRLNGMLIDLADGGQGIWSMVEDISEQRRTEAVLVEAKLAAEAANVAKSEFLANMSHEIRTPLTGVLGFADLLKRMHGLPQDAQTYIERIVTGGQALLSVVNDILDFSRLEADRIELDPHAFDPAELVEATVALIGAEAARKGLRLDSEVRGELPGVHADSSRVRQVLLNLLGNAVKFTQDGAVTLRSQYLAADGGRLRFEVTDTGPGIPSDRIHRLFQRFSQVDGSNTRRYGGAGLGLAISKSLVDLMGGELGVESREGEGSTFWFTVRAPAAERPRPAPSREVHAAGPNAGRILVVDDVAVNRELVRAMLAPFDFEVTEAADGAEAVAAALRSGFDIILMDQQMPGMDGLAATRAIRATSELNRRTPILALSANVLAVHLAACRDAGMNDHIGKPIAPAELLTKVSHWSAVRAPEAEARSAAV